MLFAILPCIVNAQVQKNRTPEKPFTKTLTTPTPEKTLSVPAGNTRPARPNGPDTTGRPGDSLVNTIDTFTVNYSKDTLDAPVKRQAVDSAIFLVKEKKFILYGKAVTEYKDNRVDAAYIEMDNDQKLLKARAQLDSAGAVAEQVKMVSGTETVYSDS
ncbi:MAG: hypothetical protein JNM68_02000, partial [Dinghuibacter sp.]|nr:hypothetical protein [Dinghuibacter sp.]